jgi:hypothetical protein
LCLLRLFAAHDQLQPNHVDSAGDFFLGDQLSLAGAWTNRACLLPRFRAGNVAFPKGPGAALPWPNRIDRASGLAIVEDTIAVGLLLQAPFTVTQPRVKRFSLFLGFTAMLGNGGDFLFVHPDKPGRSGAAIAASRAAKAQTILIPSMLHNTYSNQPGSISDDHLTLSIQARQVQSGDLNKIE